MKKPFTPKEKEAGIEKILSECPSVTREKLKEMMSAGGPVEDGREMADYLSPEILSTLQTSSEFHHSRSGLGEVK